MESADEVRASLAIAALAELREHEGTSPDGEARVADLLAGAGVLSWPLVVDRESGLILDGAHRARVLRRERGARFVAVQQVTMSDGAVRVGAWSRVIRAVPPAVFEEARRALGLVPEAAGGLVCHYGGRAYGRPAQGAVEAYALAAELERRLASNGHHDRMAFVGERETAAWLAVPGAAVLRLPALDKPAVRRRAAEGLLPPKSTRFEVAFRVIGLALPLDALAGPRAALDAALARERERALVCLGPDLEVDRRYPERLWQFSDYRIPDRLFADPAGRRAYRAALARATRPAAPRP
jgi:hypothetical protein